MNYKIICSSLGAIAIILGVCMLLCLPWGLPAFGGGPEETRGAFGLIMSSSLAFLAGAVFFFFGRGADREKLFRKEAIVIVASSWILAIVIGALPYLFAKVDRGSGEPMSVCDALFESASGMTTTGATVFSELEDTRALPRSILFWRATTHFLGGLGVMCLFVVLLGHGMSGKTVMKLEHMTAGNVPIAKMRSLAFMIFQIYLALTLASFIVLKLLGMTVFDAISHAFSVVALGGFSSHNASVAYLFAEPGAHAVAIECALIFFMVVSGTNYWLLYWVIMKQPGKLFHDSEWRLYVGLLLAGVVIAVGFGMWKGDFRTGPAPAVAKGEAFDVVGHIDRTQFNDGSEDPQTINRRPKVTVNTSAEKSGLGAAVVRAAFQVVSLATGAGFATDRYELWNASTLIALIVLMFIGGCSGSTAGGAKVFRVLLAFKVFFQSLAEKFSPNVVRVTRVDGENVDKDTLHSAVTYIFAMAALVFVMTAFVAAYEPDKIWLARGESQVEKIADIYVASVSMFANVGPAFGALGSFENYGELSDPTKFVFSWGMLLGRLEIWTVLSLFVPSFWRNR